jgi:hypothetical protein
MGIIMNEIFEQIAKSRITLEEFGDFIEHFPALTVAYRHHQQSHRVFEPAPGPRVGGAVRYCCCKTTLSAGKSFSRRTFTFWSNS